MNFIRRTALLAFCVSAICTSPVGASPSASNIRSAPPSPAIPDAQYVAELRARRESVASEIGPDAVLILFSGEPRVYARDVDYEFRQENNLFYLTRLEQQGATLVLMPGNTVTPEILFLPKREPSRETWNGYMYSPEDAQRISGISEIWEASQFDPFIAALKSRRPFRPEAENILMSPLAPARQTDDEDEPSGYEDLFAAAADGRASLYLMIPWRDDPEYAHEQEFAADWARTWSGYVLRSAGSVFSEMRLVKSPLEMKLLRHAVDITIEAVERAMAQAGSARSEYELESVVESTFKLRNSSSPAYPSIVGSGANATTLHYVSSQGPITRGDLLLMDVGAEYGHYAADITRTFPVDGKFTRAQADIYQIVYDAQNAAADAIRPGGTHGDVHDAAVEVVKAGLLKLGLITDPGSMQYRTWFMHGTSHYLGMNVHDPGERGAELKPGMVFTIEPGIYIRNDALDYLPDTEENRAFIKAVKPAFEKYRGIGVRIEDDVRVGPGITAEWLSDQLPRSIRDIEAFMRKTSAAGAAR